MLIILIVCVLYVAAHRSDDDDDHVDIGCPACSDSSCEVRENVKVKALCADSLCVGGNPVVIGDGNPCTSDDIVDGKPTHVPIKECCTDDASCEQWMPEPCHLSTCIKDDNSTFGFCVHTEVPNCCTQSCDCPDKPCKSKECTPSSGAEGVYMSFDKRSLTLVKHSEAVLSAPGTCTYTDLPASADCCLGCGDCVNGPKNTVGVCAANNECCYIPSTQFQCTQDVQCQNDTRSNEICARKGPCFANVCDFGWCTCKFDADLDFDQDNVTCKFDCDDHNANVSVPIFCPKGNLTLIDPDHDDVYPCGNWVDEICNTTCPNGAVPINRTDVRESNVPVSDDDDDNHSERHRKRSEPGKEGDHDKSDHEKSDRSDDDDDHKKRFFLAFHCDCCSNATGPDFTIYCGQDQNHNGVFADVAIGTRTPCAVSKCVPQPTNDTNDSPHHGGRGHNEPNTTVLDDICAATFGDDFIFAPPGVRTGCDKCDTTPVRHNHVLTPEDCPIKINGQSVCDDVSSKDACCDELFARLDPEHPPEDFEEVVSCCKSVNCVAGDAGFPIESQVCNCTIVNPDSCILTEPQPEPPCDDIAFTGAPVSITCVFDKDHDGYFDCNHNKTICIGLPERAKHDHSDSSHSDTRDSPSDTHTRKRGAHGGGDKGSEHSDSTRSDSTRSSSTGSSSSSSSEAECPDIHDIDPTTAEGENRLCQIVFSTQRAGGLQYALNGVSEEQIAEGHFDGTFCDCNDKDEDAFEKIVCLADKDEDTFPSCPAFLAPLKPNNVYAEPDRTAECTSVCAGECPRGSKPPKEFKDKHGNHVCTQEYRKRSAPASASLSALHAAAAAHSWFVKRNPQQGGDRGSDHGSDKSDKSDDDDDHREELRPRDDKTCDCPYTCTLCDCCDIDCAVYEYAPTLVNLAQHPRFGSADKTKCNNYNYGCDHVVFNASHNPRLVFDLPFAVCPGAPPTHCRKPGEKEHSDSHSDSESHDNDKHKRGVSGGDGSHDDHDVDRRLLYSIFDASNHLNPDIFYAFDNTLHILPLDQAGSCDDEQNCKATPGWEVSAALRRRKRDLTVKLQEACKSHVELAFASASNNTILVTDPKTHKTRPLAFGDCGEFLIGCTTDPGTIGGGEPECVPDCATCTRIA